MSMQQEAGEKKNLEEKIQCIFFDGRQDKTKVMEMNEVTGKFHSTVKVEEHYSMTVEPDGRYVDHFVPEQATENVPTQSRLHFT